MDALRGYAILAILLIHSVEQFDVYFSVPHTSTWLDFLDQPIQQVVYFLFAGKVYPLFSFLFGVTFYWQWNKVRPNIAAFRLRFVKRMFWLFLFGVVNSLFYQGDILLMYSVVALLLLPVFHLKDKYLWTIIILCFFQPIEWIRLINGYFHPVADLPDPLSWTYYNQMSQYIFKDSFIGTAYGNITNGKLAGWIWTWEEGRVPQIYAMFLLGFVVAKQEWLLNAEKIKHHFVKIITYGVVLFVGVFVLKIWVMEHVTTESIHRPAIVLLNNWANLSYLLVLVTVFARLYYMFPSARIFRALSYPGRMSLTNYMLQSCIGAFIFYGYGLALYSLSTPYNLLIGLGVALVLMFTSRWWIQKYGKGPMETLWNRLNA